jgi:hypothetical protein
LTCADPTLMLEFLRASGRASKRKLRLFAVACCRRIWPLLADERSRKAVEVAEKYADGLVDQQQWLCAEAEGKQAATGFSELTLFAGWAAKMTVANHIPLLHVVRYTPVDIDLRAEVIESKRHGQSSLLRDLFGNPFRPVSLDPAWQTSTVCSLAHAAYEGRFLPSGHLDDARLAVLADALEEAGCTDSAILDHLRSAGPHVRGCGIIDLLTGRE